MQSWPGTSQFPETHFYAIVGNWASKGGVQRDNLQS
jgi:hypothetical protein